MTTTNGYHPLARCPEATEKYFEWVDVAESYKKGSKQYEKACLRYKWHVAGCDVCQEGLDAHT